MHHRERDVRTCSCDQGGDTSLEGQHQRCVFVADVEGWVGEGDCLQCDFAMDAHSLDGHVWVLETEVDSSNSLPQRVMWGIAYNAAQ